MTSKGGGGLLLKAPLPAAKTYSHIWMDDITFWKRLVVKIIYFYHVECSPPGYLVCLVAFFIRIIIIFWDAQNLCTALHDQYLPSTPPTQTWIIWPHTQTCPSRRRYRTRLLALRHNNQCDKNNLCCCCLFIWFPIGCVPHYCSKVVWRPQISYYSCCHWLKCYI